MPQVVDYADPPAQPLHHREPRPRGRRRRAPMDFAILTGDQADNQQQNETTWVRQLIEGGQTVDPNSGSQRLLATATCSTRRP